MAVIRKAGKTKLVHLPVTPSTALTKDTLVKFSSGKLVAVSGGDAGAIIVGVIRKTIAATDTDYASDRLVPVEIPLEKHVLWEMDVDGNLAATDVGTEYDIHDAGTIDHDGTTDQVAKIVQYLSATKARVWLKINGSY